MIRANVGIRGSLAVAPTRPKPIPPAPVVPATLHSVTSKVTLCSAGFSGIMAANRHLAGRLDLRYDAGVKAFLANPPADGSWVVLGGWSDCYTRILAARRWRVAVHWHSNLAQMDADSNGDLTAFLAVLGRLRTGQIDAVLMTAESDARMLSRALGDPRVRWLPDVYNFARLPSDLPAVEAQREPPWVPVYVTPQGRKNLSAQFVALRALGANVWVAPRMQSRGFLALATAIGLDVEMHELPWSHSEPRAWAQALLRAPFAVHVSFAETFCYAAADFWALRIPCIVSRAVPLARYLDPWAAHRVVVEEFQCPGAIYSVLSWLRDNPAGAEDAGHACREALESIDREHTAAAAATLDSL